MSKLSLEFRAMDAMHSIAIALDLIEEVLPKPTSEEAERALWALHSANRRARELHDAIAESPSHVNGWTS